MVPTRTYLAATTVAGVALKRAERTDRASHVLAGPSPDLWWTAGARDGGKGTTVKPLDGGALSLVGNVLAGEGTPGGAATHLSGLHGRLYLDLTYVGAREEGERQGKREGRKGGAGCGRVPRGAALHLHRPHRRPGATPNPLPLPLCA
jgi:hypothetical protein